MVDVEVSVMIERGVEEVFEFVRDPENIPKWDLDLIKVTKTTEGPIGLGSTFHLEIKPFMGASEGTGEVVAYEPDRRIELQFRMGRMNPRVAHIFEPSDGGTKFTRHVQLKPEGLVRLMQPVMPSMMRKRNREYLANLKRLLEG